MDKYKIFISVLLLSLSTQARTIAKNDGKQVYALELYTSESCSSCPPADRHLSKMVHHPDLWKKYVPMAFHVDYWNHLSWKDRFSSKKMTQRQSLISQSWGTQRIYTPGFVLNGKEVPAWNSTPLPTYQAQSSIEITVIEEPSKVLKARVQGLDPKKVYQVHLAVLGFGIETKVTSGENKGENLVHDFVVMNWTEGKIDPGSKASSSLELKPASGPYKQAVVAWVEELNKPVPLQITGGFL